MTINISSAFDSGNIRCVDCADPSNIQLEIHKDHQSDFYQWFHFRLTGAQDINCTLNILNAGGSAYTDGWTDYQAVASYDRMSWFRVDCEFDGQVLSIHHEPEFDSVYFAYFAPYSMERHSNLIAEAQLSEHAQYIHLGHTLDGQDMDLLQIGYPSENKKSCWLIARQHPGETMAEWWMEGFLDRLLDEDDPVSRELLDKAVFYVVPNMNPDGSRRGHLRTNAVGANLNREWLNPTQQRSPEVLLVREMMHKTGVDFSLDVHGDEALPYNFIAGAEGITDWSERLAGLQQQFKSALLKASPDFQTEHGYPVGAPGQATLKMCTDYVAQTFDCLAMTLEMPFKDTVDSPDHLFGWSPIRCKHLGSAALNAIHDIIDDLR